MKRFGSVLILVLIINQNNCFGQITKQDAKELMDQMKVERDKSLHGSSKGIRAADKLLNHLWRMKFQFQMRFADAEMNKKLTPLKLTEATSLYEKYSSEYAWIEIDFGKAYDEIRQATTNAQNAQKAYQKGDWEDAYDYALLCLFGAEAAQNYLDDGFWERYPTIMGYYVDLDDLLP